MQMDSQPIDLDLLQKHPEMFVFFSIELRTKSIFRFEHPYFDEIEAFEPNEILLKPVEPRVITNHRFSFHHIQF